MDRVDLFLQAAATPTVYFIRYTRIRSENRDFPIFVFEGIDDPKYYSSRISYRFGSDWSLLVVDGKSNVLDLHAAIRGNEIYKNDKAAFFIDNDFDENVDYEDDIYRTPCYSIENLYLNDGSVKHLVLSLGEFSKQTEEDCVAVNWLVERYKVYYCHYSNDKNVKRVNLIYLYVRRNFVDKKIFLDQIFSIDHCFEDGYFFKISIKTKGEELFGNVSLNDFASFIRRNGIARKILRGDCGSYRGKQQIKFMREFVSSIKSENSPLQKEFRRETGLRFVFKNTGFGSDLLADLSCYAQTPNCLSKFLDNIFVKFNPDLNI